MSLAIGQGVDVHRLVRGRPLVIGGVAIPYEFGLIGDSDGDVLTHALIDALLGAAHLGDMGRWFRRGDPSVMGASSLDLLARTARLVREEGWRMINADLTVLAEAPRLGPHQAAMEENLARAMAGPPESVSVKAKSTDGLGLLGRGEGIGAIAVVLMERDAISVRNGAG